MSFLWFLIIGAVAGWLAGLVMKGGGFGLLINIIVGIVGGVIGGYEHNPRYSVFQRRIDEVFRPEYVVVHRFDRVRLHHRNVFVCCAVKNHIGLETHYNEIHVVPVFQFAHHGHN